MAYLSCFPGEEIDTILREAQTLKTTLEQTPWLLVPGAPVDMDAFFAYATTGEETLTTFHDEISNGDTIDFINARVRPKNAHHVLALVSATALIVPDYCERSVKRSFRPVGSKCSASDCSVMTYYFATDLNPSFACETDFEVIAVQIRGNRLCSISYSNFQDEDAYIKQKDLLDFMHNASPSKIHWQPMGDFHYNE